MSNEDPTPPPIAPPQNIPRPTPPDQPTTFIDSMVPSKNGNALTSYYLGLLSIIPCAGLFMGPIALVTGTRALKAEKANPAIKGRTHAKVGIGCGFLGLLFNLAIVALAIAIAINPHSKS